MLLQKDDRLSLEKAAELLAAGNIVILPTDTVYGFSGIVDLKGAEKKDCGSLIRRIKGRDEGKPFIELISSPDEITDYTDEPIPDELLSLWPGPLTLIVPLKKDSPLDTDLSTVAFRCPGDGWLRRVIARTGRPLYSSSVNRSGSPVLSSIAAIEKEFAAEVPLIISDGDKNGSLPSTIVSVGSGGIRLIRQGTLKIPAGLTASTAACP